MTHDRNAQRRATVRQRLGELGLDALLVTHLVNVRYLTGFTGSNATLLLGVDGDDLLVTDGRYAEQVAEEAPGLRVVITRAGTWLEDAVHPGALVGVEPHTITWEQLGQVQESLPGRNLVGTERLVEDARMIKDDVEVTALRRACRITAKALERVPAWLTPGLTEQQVAARLHHDMVDLGADDRAFELIVAAGPNAAKPHHRPGVRPIGAGDVVQFDIGALVDGYHADMSRVVAVGTPEPELEAVHRVVAEAQAAGRAAIGDGVTAGAVDEACRAVIDRAGHGEHFLHPAGHAVGLEIHEQPILRAGSAARLRSHMAVTVEPGIYLPGLGGIRIEDVVVVTATGADVLTEAPRDLLVV